MSDKTEDDPQVTHDIPTPDLSREYEREAFENATGFFAVYGTFQNRVKHKAETYAGAIEAGRILKGPKPGRPAMIYAIRPDGHAVHIINV